MLHLTGFVLSGGSRRALSKALCRQLATPNTNPNNTTKNKQQSVTDPNVQTMADRWLAAGRPKYPDFDALMAGLVDDDYPGVAAGAGGGAGAGGAGGAGGGGAGGAGAAGAGGKGKG